MIAALRVEPGRRSGLVRRPTDQVRGLEMDKKAGLERLAELRPLIATLQQRLFAEDRRSLLVVLQGTDTSGKDGVIREVFSGVSPSGTVVAAFKAPTSIELAHDFLWRVHAVCPERGQIGIFNRSHYEDVVAARVRKVVPERQWRARYEHIRQFERLLSDEGTTMVKCFLHLSSDEQRARLQARLEDPEKRWKFRLGDLEDRAMWDQFRAAYEQALTKTSTKLAPWYVVPADRKWLARLCVAEIVYSTLATMDPQIPPGEEGLDDLTVT